MWKKFFSGLALLSVWTICLYGDENNTGLTGIQEIIVPNGKMAPNGYLFDTSNPDIYTGFVSYRFDSEGSLGIRSSAPGGYGAWELKPWPQLKPGDRYLVSADLYHSKFAPGQYIGIEVYSFNQADQPKILTHILQNTVATNQWHTIAGEIIVPEDSVKIRVRVDLTLPGTLYFRNLKVTSPLAIGQQKQPIALLGADLELFKNWRQDLSTVNPVEHPTVIKTVDGMEISETVAISETATKTEIRFELNNETGRLCSGQWRKVFDPVLMAGPAKYYKLTFRAQKFFRTMPPAPLFSLMGTDPDGKVFTLPLVDTALAMDDGEFHTVTGVLPEGATISQLIAQLRTRSSSASLELQGLEFSDRIFLESEKSAVFEKFFKPVDIKRYLNASMKQLSDEFWAQYQKIIDGQYQFTGKNIEIAGIPFEVESSKMNLAIPALTDRNGEKIEFLGETLTHYQVNPFAREDQLTLPVNQRGSELYLLLFNYSAPTQVRYALPPRPARFDDMENLTIELTYEDGSVDQAFPYSISDRAFYISNRMVGAFAVPLNPAKTVKDVILKFGSYNVHLGVAAVTINTGTAQVPALAARPAEKILPVAAISENVKTKISYQDKLLTFSNPLSRFVFDLKNGFSFQSLQIDGKAVTLSPASGLRLTIGNTIYSGRSMEVKKVMVSDQQADLTLIQPVAEVEIRLQLSSDSSGGIVWQGTVRNIGKQTEKIVLSMGYLQNLSFGNKEYDSIFFPQYRAAITRDFANFRAPYGLEYLHAFFDFFNPQENVGLVVLADQSANMKNEFFARKNESGMSGGVALQADFAELAPQAEIVLPAVTLQVHQGDFKTAAAYYKKLLDRDYRTFNAQNKKSFIDTFVMNTYHTNDTLSRLYFQVPPVLSKDKKTYHLDEIIDFDTKNMGRKPDFVHFWWSYNDAKKQEQHGWYDSPEYYAQVGSLEAFRKQITHLQDDLGVDASLYTISEHYINNAMPKNMPEIEDIATIYPGGSVMANEHETYTCRYAQKWLDYVVNDLAGLMEKTGAKILYSDVMGSFNGTRCYSRKHGHGVPSNSLESDLRFIRALREGLPKDRIIWTEYTLPDTISGYADGSVNYYFMEMNEYFAPTFDIDDRINQREFQAPFALVRYLLPNYKIFSLPCGIEAGSKISQVDYIFFNGEAFHEVTWRLIDSRTRKKINQALAIKKAYSDCFNAPNPEFRYPTLYGGVYANRFPGEKRTVWTLLNANPSTVRGKIIAIPHQPGAKYFDLSNQTELIPEINGKDAIIELAINPQQVIAITQEL